MRLVVVVAVRCLRACAVLVGCLWAAACGTPDADRALDVDPAPAATAWVLDTAGARVDALHRGRAATAVFVFVSTHCPISNRYAPTMTALRRRYAGEVDFFAVYPDPADTMAKVTAHQSAFGVAMPVLRDPEHVLVSYVGARVTPEAAVVDRSAERSILTYSGRIDDRAVEFGVFRPGARVHHLAEAIERTRGGDRALVREPAVGCYIADLR